MTLLSDVKHARATVQAHMTQAERAIHAAHHSMLASVHTPL
jgi:hypothetical protein